MEQITAENRETAPQNQTDRAIINAYTELQSVRKAARRLSCTNYKIHSTLKRYKVRMAPQGFKTGKNPAITGIEALTKEDLPRAGARHPGAQAPKEALSFKERKNEKNEEEKEKDIIDIQKESKYLNRSEGYEREEGEVSYYSSRDSSRVQISLIDDVITKGLKRIKKELPSMKPSELNTIVSSMIGKKIELTKVNLDIVQTNVIKKLFGNLAQMKTKLEEIRKIGTPEGGGGGPPLEN